MHGRTTLLGRPLVVIAALVVSHGIGAAFVTGEMRGPAPPANDECDGAVQILCNTELLADNTTATIGPWDRATCRLVPSFAPGSIWFTFVATHTSVRIATCDSAAPADDSYLEVFAFDPQDPCATLASIGCNEDGCGGFLSRLDVLNLTIGRTYYIMLASFSTADRGVYQLRLDCPSPAPMPPANDACAGAVPLSGLPASVDGSTAHATPDPAGLCGGPGESASGVWYRVVAHGDRLRAQTCVGSDYDTVLRAYRGSCSSPECITLNDDACGEFSRITWSTTPGEEYLILVGGAGSAVGSFTLTVDEPPPPCGITVPPGAVAEGEPGCGLPEDTINAGCPSARARFSAIPCGVPVYGTAAFAPPHRDHDWYRFVLSEPTEVTLTVRANFAALIGFGGTNIENPTGRCEETTGAIAPSAQTGGNCQESSVSAVLGPGVWSVVVTPSQAATPTCGAGDHEYLAVLTYAGGCAQASDCNANGVDDALEIALDRSLDCFGPFLGAAPPTMVGADGVLDRCQCRADWNRSGVVNSMDISRYLSTWLDDVTGLLPVDADLDCSGSANAADISAFLTLWIGAVQGTDPMAGCP